MSTHDIRAMAGLHRQRDVEEAVEAGRVIVLFGTSHDADRFQAVVMPPDKVMATAPPARWDSSLAPLLAGAAVIVVGLGMRPVLGPEVATAVLAAGAVKAKYVHLGDIDFAKFADAANATEWVRAEAEGAPVVPFEKRQEQRTAVARVDWPEVIPLEGDMEIDEFPVDSLPETARTMVEAVAASTAAPVGFAGCVALGTLAALTARGVVVEAPGEWAAPLNAYVVTVLPVGEGKSPVFRAFTKVLAEIEDRWMAEAASDIADARTRKDIAEGVAAQAKRDAAAGKVSKEHAIRLAQEAREIEIPPEPRIHSRDVTPEGIVRVCASNGGTLALLSDEGAELFQLMSRYSANGGANYGVYFAGHDGQRYTRDRAGGETIIIPRLTLSVCCTIQPSVLGELARDRDNRERGLLARFLLAQPPSSVGYRSTDDVPIAPDAVAQWEDLLWRLAGQVWARNEPAVLRLSREATGVWRRWRAETEPRLRPDVGDLHAVVDWANKARSHLIRLAGLLHVAKTGRIEGEIDLGVMADAIGLFEYFGSHTRKAFAEMSASADAHIARRLLAWLRRKRLATFTTREAFQQLKNSAVQQVSDVQAAITVLEECGYVQAEARPQERGRGQAPSPRYLVNPVVVAETTGEEAR